MNHSTAATSTCGYAVKTSVRGWLSSFLTIAKNFLCEKGGDDGESGERKSFCEGVIEDCSLWQKVSLQCLEL